MSAELVQWLRGVLRQVEAEHRLAKALAERDGLKVDLYAPPWIPADIAAKRAILDLHAEAMGTDFHGNCPGTWVGYSDDPAEPCPTLRLLASAYADRPGYREEWRP